MRSFDEIYELSAHRKGGADALELLIGSTPKSAKALANIPDDRWLAIMTKCIFQAGFNWKVVDAMWPGFEEAFEGFEIGHCLMLMDEDFERLVSDTRIVRYGAKIRAVQQNAGFIASMADQGGIGKVIGEWPSNDYIGLLAMLKKQAARMGGNTGQYCMRFQGRDGFILSRDVISRLIAENVIDKEPKSQKAMAQVQNAFNIWMDQSGRSLTEVSRVVAMSL
jgi:3-methyladenine DNA glycosylase Tag